MITHLNEKLIAVEVPSDAKYFHYHKSDWDKQMGDINCLQYSLPMQRNEKGNWTDYGYVQIGKDPLNDDLDFKILGEVDADNISFDVEPYVLKDTEEKNILGTLYWCYVKNIFNFHNEKHSFRSLLQSKGIDTNKPNVKHVILEKL